MKYVSRASHPVRTGKMPVTRTSWAGMPMPQHRIQKRILRAFAYIASWLRFRPTAFMHSNDWSRRRFVQFFGAAAVVAATNRVFTNWAIASEPASDLFAELSFQPVPVSTRDEVVLPDGFAYDVLLKQGDPINPRGDRYGDHNDYLAVITGDRESGWLWTNHENVSLEFVTGDWSQYLTQERAALLLQNMGGSCLLIRRAGDGRWRPEVPAAQNFRVNGLDSRLQLTGPGAGSEWVGGAKEVLGSISNCGGGISPWGTFFSAEENYQNFFFDAEIAGLEQGKPVEKPAVELYFPRLYTHYGYMVEIDPQTGELFKHTALGRFSHENIAFTLSRDGRLVAYLGDDRQDQCLYKFVSRDRYNEQAGKKNRALLADGTLYVANVEAGRWIALDAATQPALRRYKFDPARVAVHTRTAAQFAGGTPLARPEDVEVHPVTRDVYVSLTAYSAPKRTWEEELLPDNPKVGAIARLRELNADPGAEEFQFDIFVLGGADSGLYWPDNLSFSAANHLLVATDFKQSPDVPDAGNNYLCVIPTAGPQNGKVTRFAVAPRDAEFCSPTLSPNGQELWVNVQHPGEASTSDEKLTSHWPDGGDALPRSAMIAIRRT
jgi:uncharacterized protein